MGTTQMTVYSKDTKGITCKDSTGLKVAIEGCTFDMNNISLDDVVLVDDNKTIQEIIYSPSNWFVFLNMQPYPPSYGQKRLAICVCPIGCDSSLFINRVVFVVDASITDDWYALIKGDSIGFKYDFDKQIVGVFPTYYKGVVV